MAIVSKEITWTEATREQLSDYIADANAQINVTWLSDTSAYVQGDSVELQKYRDFLATRGIIVTIVGDGPPIPVPEVPLPTPSGTVLDSDIWQQATNAIREEDRQATLARVNAKYDSLGGTRQP